MILPLHAKDIVWFDGINPVTYSVQTDRDLGVSFQKSMTQRIGSICIILLVHQTYKVLWQLHNGYTLTTPLMAGQGS